VEQLANSETGKKRLSGAASLDLSDPHIYQLLVKGWEAGVLTNSETG